MAGRSEEPLADLARVPTCVIHSRDDQVVPFAQAEERVRSLERLGRRVRFDPLAGIGYYEMGSYLDALERGARWIAQSGHNERLYPFPGEPLIQSPRLRQAGRSATMRTMLRIVAIAFLCTAYADAQQASPAWQPPPPTPGALKPQQATIKADTVEFVLQPKEGMEYRYRLERDAAFLFSWSASAPVHYELHSVPDGAPSDFAETFDKQDDRPGATGSYTAPFTGIHGWYWQNRTDKPVTLKLSATGFFTESQEFRRGQAPRSKKF